MAFHYVICSMPGRHPPIRTALCTPSYMAWQIGPGLRLQSEYTGTRLLPGYLQLADAGYDRSPGDARALAADCLALCRRLDLPGLVCDFEQPVRRELARFIAEAADCFLARGLPVFVPERYASCHPKTTLLLSTALCSGSLPRRLRAAAAEHGTSRLALEMPLLRQDIELPGQGGLGQTLSRQALAELLARRGGQTFFSRELCARYFTQRDDAGITHFIVYDDRRSFDAKAELADAMGIRQGFVLYPDAAELALF